MGRAQLKRCLPRLKGRESSHGWVEAMAAEPGPAEEEEEREQAEGKTAGEERIQRGVEESEEERWDSGQCGDKALTAESEWSVWLSSCDWAAAAAMKRRVRFVLRDRAGACEALRL